MDIPITVYALFGVAALGLFYALNLGKRDSRMPPGPPTIPILGNAHQIPSTGLYKQLVPVPRVHRFAKLDFDLPLCRFREWSKEYGSVFTLKLGSANVVVLCDRKAIHKLLVEKGSIYSDRPGSYVGKLLTKGDHLALEQMTPIWREKRKIISHNFSPNQLDQKHFKVQEAE